MPENHLYEYAVIRVLPKVERGEFINAGVILFSKKTGYIKVLHKLDENKLRLFSTEIDPECLKAALQVFDQVCRGAEGSGKIAEMDAPERFRWLTAVRSSCIQTSRPHPGFSSDLDATLKRLFRELVL